MTAVQRVLHAAEREHDDQGERDENNERADEPGRRGPAAAPFPMAHSSARRIGEASAHVMLRARCDVRCAAYAEMHMKYTRRRAIRSVAQAFLPVPTQQRISVVNAWRLSRHRSVRRSYATSNQRRQRFLVLRDAQSLANWGTGPSVLRVIPSFLRASKSACATVRRRWMGGIAPSIAFGHGMPCPY